MTKAEQARNIRDCMTCGHCKATFAGTAKQAQRVVYEAKTVFCSDACRHSWLREKFSKPVPNRGPCLGCGESFFSRREAKFCGIKCYTGSSQFSDMLADSRAKASDPESIARRAEAAKRGGIIRCLECSQEIYAKRSEKNKKYCGKICYRAYMAKRFDRQIASPEQMALPQGYDAFLDREELNCLIQGCDWHGKHLSIHMNSAHGINADEFKRAAGFNMTTGVVAKDLAQQLREREKRGVALDASFWTPDGVEMNKQRIGYVSNEAREHQKKSRALSGIGPQRTCVSCGCAFVQSTNAGRALYCTKECRKEHYSNIGKQQRQTKKTVPQKNVSIGPDEA